jgi:hypothetical protein
MPHLVILENRKKDPTTFYRWQLCHNNSVVLHNNIHTILSIIHAISLCDRHYCDCDWNFCSPLRSPTTNDDKMVELLGDFSLLSLLFVHIALGTFLVTPGNNWQKSDAGAFTNCTFQKHFYCKVNDRVCRRQPEQRSICLTRKKQYYSVSYNN